MSDPVDVFADGFRVYMGSYGSALHFYATTEREHIGDSDRPLSGVLVGTVRVSPEFVKGMVFYLYQRVRQYEKEGGPIVMNSGTLQRLTEGDRETWDHLWGQSP